MTDATREQLSTVQLGIFAKPPREHRVKTRLIPDIGAENATAVYRHCLQHALDIAADSQLNRCCYLTEASSDRLFQGLTQKLQTGDNLGDRMLNAFIDMLKHHDTAIIIGTDCLDMSSEHLLRAARLLEEYDIVVQPVFDGGYSLIGCRQIDPSLFTGVRWSSAEVLSKTLHNAEALNYRVTLLETVRDIDTLEDLQHYPQLQHLLAERAASD